MSVRTRDTAGTKDRPEVERSSSDNSEGRKKRQRKQTASRKEQNRLAQQKYRDRKDKRLEELERELADSREENRKLSVQVTELRELILAHMDTRNDDRPSSSGHVVFSANPVAGSIQQSTAPAPGMLGANTSFLTIDNAALQKDNFTINSPSSFASLTSETPPPWLGNLLAAPVEAPPKDPNTDYWLSHEFNFTEATQNDINDLQFLFDWNARLMSKGFDDTSGIMNVEGLSVSAPVYPFAFGT